jgi:hypothetical protein
MLSADELAALIKFHDKKRLFIRTALLPNARTYEVLLGKSIPPNITIEQARRIQSAVDSKPLRVNIPASATDYRTHVVRPRIVDDPELHLLWKKLTPLEQRAVTALAALDEHAEREGTGLCTADVAALWPTPHTSPMFVWNSKIGFGFVGPEDVIDADKAHVWLWRSRRHLKSAYSMQYWHGVVGCSEDAVEDLEENAFGRGY